MTHQDGAVHGQKLCRQNIERGAFYCFKKRAVLITKDCITRVGEGTGHQNISIRKKQSLVTIL
jgi:hypothetical protein